MSVPVGAGRKNRSPGVHDHAAPVGPASVSLLAPLGRGENERLVLDGAGAEQQLPMVFASLERERGGHRQNLGSSERQQAVELRES